LGSFGFALTPRETFDVISFANCPVFRIGSLFALSGRIAKLMNDNFLFADPVLVHRVSPHRRTSILRLLNPAHPKSSPVSFLSWRLRMGSEGVR
jgi:hypothetical protein